MNLNWVDTPFGHITVVCELAKIALFRSFSLGQERRSLSRRHARFDRTQFRQIGAFKSQAILRSVSYRNLVFICTLAKYTHAMYVSNQCCSDYGCLPLQVMQGLFSMFDAAYVTRLGPLITRRLGTKYLARLIEI